MEEARKEISAEGIRAATSSAFSDGPAPPAPKAAPAKQFDENRFHCPPPPATFSMAWCASLLLWPLICALPLVMTNFEWPLATLLSFTGTRCVGLTNLGTSRGSEARGSGGGGVSGGGGGSCDGSNRTLLAADGACSSTLASAAVGLAAGGSSGGGLGAAEECAWPSPVGLFLGILAVVVGMFFVLVYHWLRWHGWLGVLRPVQREGARNYSFWEGVAIHLAQPEGVLMLGGYLAGTWMFSLMPSSYYSFAGGVDWPAVAGQLLVQDALQYGMHCLEHKLSSALYRLSHKPHHRFTNPRLFDAFNGSPADTLLMILVPLFTTAHVVRCNVWSYMAFGSLYANWLTLVHSEWSHPWDQLFRMVGFGTAADHHVHHRLFVFNYGHLFMYWDRLGGTYKDPANVSVFNAGV
ncbi:unnamed protein product [Phaeothamnion confervicola]